MRLRWALGLVVAASACGKSTSECRKEAHDVSALLMAMEREAPVVHLDETTHLVKRTDVTTKAKGAPGLVVSGSKLQLAWRDIGLDDLGPALDEVHRGVDRTLLDVAIDQATPWSTVVTIAHKAHAAGFTRVALLFERPVTLAPPPPRSKVDDEIDRLMKQEPSDRATKFAELAMTTIKGCSKLEEAFGSVGGETDVDKGELLIKAIEPSLVDCNCSPDVSALRSLMYRLLLNEHPTVAITLDLDPAATAVILAGKTPWREASAKLTKDGAAWLDVSSP